LFVRSDLWVIVVCPRFCTVFAVQARYEVSLMETEDAIDRVLVIAEVLALLDKVATATGLR
jgi:hypothetical protein